MILHIFRIANQHLLEHLQYRAKNMNHAFIGNPLDLKWGREHVYYFYRESLIRLWNSPWPIASVPVISETQYICNSVWFWLQVLGGGWPHPTSLPVSLFLLLILSPKPTLPSTMLAWIKPRKEYEHCWVWEAHISPIKYFIGCPIKLIGLRILHIGKILHAPSKKVNCVSILFLQILSSHMYIVHKHIVSIEVAAFRCGQGQKSTSCKHIFVWHFVVNLVHIVCCTCACAA